MYKLDSNHIEIRDAFLTLGCRVMDIARAKHYTDGTLDLVVGIPNTYSAYNGLGTIIIVEVKTPEGKLKQAQEQTIKDWREANLPVEVVRSTAEVERILHKYQGKMAQNAENEEANEELSKRQ